VQICFSKGLGCAMGAILAGSDELIEEAWRLKFLFGGALRQAGVVAAGMLYALEHNVERLAEDHARAKRLAQELAAAGLPVDVDATETNFVGIDVGSIGVDVADAQARIRAEGVLVGRLRPGVLRVATHLGVTDDHVDQAIELIPRALGVLAPA
jgi:threonine aldolase